MPAGSAVTLTEKSYPVYGERLTVDTTALPESTYGKLSYQWQRNGAPIKGATKRFYTVTWEDIGKEITVTVSAANFSGSVSATAGVIE